MNFEPQKVLELSKALSLKTPKIHGTYLITEKLDGWYVYINYSKEHGWDMPRSSAGRVIPSLKWSKSLFTSLGKLSFDCTLIAEVTIEDLPFHILNGRLNRSVGNCDCLDAIFNLHDIVVYGKLYKAIDRYNILQNLIGTIVTDNLIKVVPVQLASEFDKTIWYRVFDRLVDKGAEGIVAKRADSLYTFGKRNADLLKIKLELTVDCLAVGLEESIGKQGEDSLTLVSSRKNGTLIRTVINNHQDQEYFRNNSIDILGKVVVELKAMEEYPNGQLRQPVFKCIREDKTYKDID